MAVNYAFPTEGMMGPSTPIDRITARNSMLGASGLTPGEQVIAGEERNQRIKEKLNQSKQGAQDFLGRYGKYVPVAAGVASAIPGVTTALSEIGAGRPTGALGALAPTALSALGAGLLGKGGVAGTAVGLGLMGLGAVLPGAAASGLEAARQEVTGRPTEGKEGDFQTEIARRRQLAGLDLELGRSQLGMRTDNIVDLTQRLNAVDIEQKKAEYPILAKMKNDELIRSQSMLNSQNNAYMQQMVLGTASNLVLDAQRERGALARQYIASSPYNVVLAAPNVSIG
jgi:hypothetical protein